MALHASEREDLLIVGGDFLSFSSILREKERVDVYPFGKRSVIVRDLDFDERLGYFCGFFFLMFCLDRYVYCILDNGDISVVCKERGSLISSYRGHKGITERLKLVSPHVICTCGRDRSIRFWDIRSPLKSKSNPVIDLSSKEATGVDILLLFLFFF